MNLRTVIATATTAAVLSTGGVALAGATTGGSSSPSDRPAASTVAAETNHHPARRHRARHHRRMLRRAAGIVARTIDIDRKELRQEVRSGKTIAEVATAHGVDPQAVVDALVNAANRRIDRAVANGRIRAERAATIKERLPERITRIVDEWHPRSVHTGTDT